MQEKICAYRLGRLSVLLCLSCAVFLPVPGRMVGAASLTKVDTGTYGMEDYRLENQYLQVVVSPTQAGKIVSFTDKRNGKEYVFLGKGEGGFLHVFPAGEDYPGRSTAGKVFEASMVSANPAVLKVSLKGNEGLKDILLEKIFTLEEGGPYLKVQLRAVNEGYVTKTVGWRVHNTVSLGVPYDKNRHFPLTNTARGEISPTDNKWLTGLKDGWMAWLDRLERRGILFFFDAVGTEKELFWIASDPSTEWVSKATEIPPGYAMQTNVSIMPLQGIPSLEFPFGLTEASALLNQQSSSLVKVRHDEKPAVQKRPMKGLSKSIKVLVLTRWDFGDIYYGKKFPQIERRKAVKPYERFFGGIVYAQRWAFRAREACAYFLKDDPGFSIDVAYEDDFLPCLKNLYSYNVLFINDCVPETLAPYVDDLLAYVKWGGSIVVNGGYGAFGGRGPECGDYKVLESILPVRIAKTPDWIEQTDYMYSPDGISRCPVCGENLSLFGPCVAIQPDYAWLSDKKKVDVVLPFHPVVNGIPFDTLSPDYHALVPKDDAETVASIGNDPVIVAQTMGKGRLLALGISDCQRLFFWPYTVSYYRNVLRWAAGRADQVAFGRTERLPDRGFALAVRRSGPIEKRSVTVHYVIQGRSFRIYNEGDVGISRTPGDDTVILPFAGRIPEDYRLTVETDGVRQEQWFPAEGTPAPLSVSFGHRRCFLRGQEIAPELKIVAPVPQLPGSVRLKAILIDERGTECAGQQRDVSDAAKPLEKMVLKSDLLAYGDYRYVVDTIKDGQVVNTVSEPCFIGPKPDVVYPLHMCGSVPVWYLEANNYLALACARRIHEDGYNLLFHVQTYGKSVHPYDYMDQLLRWNMSVINRPVSCSHNAVPPHHSAWDLSPRDPKRLAFIDDWAFGNTVKLACYPALFGSYLDDEGRGSSFTDCDREEFRRIYGYPLPEKEPLDEKQTADRADYFIKSAGIMWKKAADAVHRASPDLKAVMVQTYVRPASVGGYLPDNFRAMDTIWMDSYPTAFTEVGETIFFTNLLRCLSERQKKPAWIILGEYREDFPTVKMQYWLTMGSALRGMGWFEMGDSEFRTGVYRKEWSAMAAYNKIVNDLAPLLASWRKPSAPVALLYSKATLSLTFATSQETWKNTSQYHDSLFELARLLYSYHIPFDVVTEEDVQKGDTGATKIIVLAGSKALAPDTVKALELFAGKNLVMERPDNEVHIKGSIPFSTDKLRSAYAPCLDTEDQEVFLQELRAGGSSFAVAYNHSHLDKQTKMHVRDISIGVVYDVLDKKPIGFERKGDHVEFVLPIAKDEGKMLCFLKEKPGPVRLEELPGQPAERIRGFKLRLAGSPGTILPVKMDVLDPDGQATWYGKTILVENGEASFFIPFAVNDKRGVWKISCESLVTGEVVTKEISVD